MVPDIGSCMIVHTRGISYVPCTYVYMDNQIVKSNISQHACYVMNRIAVMEKTHIIYRICISQNTNALHSRFCMSKWATCFYVYI